MKIAVAGGTGLTGRHVIEVLSATGHEPVVLARSTDVDLVTGAGLDAALAGADVTIDVSNVTTLKRAEAVGFFERAGRQLLGAAARAGVRHHVALSIVGSERMPGSGYMRAKVAQEAEIEAGAIPYTCLLYTSDAADE